MKSLILLFTLLTLLASCKGSSGGDDPAASEPETSCGIEYNLVGSWDSTTRNDTIIVDQFCTYEGSFCGSKGSYSPWSPYGSTKRILITIDSNNESEDCLAVGSYVCAYEIVGENKTVHYTCDGQSVATYVRQ